MFNLLKFALSLTIGLLRVRRKKERKKERKEGRKEGKKTEPRVTYLTYRRLMLFVNISCLQMAAVRSSYNSREVNFYNPAVNFSHNGYVGTKSQLRWRLSDRKLP